MSLRKGKILLAVLAMLLVVVFVAQAAISTPNMQETVVIDGTDPESPFTAWQSNRFTHIQDQNSGQVIHSIAGFKLVGENENLAFYIKEEDTSIRIVNKKNGYVWGGLRDQDLENFGDKFASFANSLVSIEYVQDGAATATSVGSGHSSVDFDLSYSKDKVTCEVDFGRCGIYLTATATLKDDHVEFAVDDRSIQETNPEFYLQKLYFAPYIGTTMGDSVPGYSFVPDGCGALIRYKPISTYLQGYDQRIYNLDRAIDSDLEANSLNATRPNDFMKEAEGISMPVYGLTHGYKQNALFGYVNGGAEYAYIMSSPAGNKNVNYNWTTAYFVYHQYYNQRTQKDEGDSGVRVMQKNINKVNAKLSLYCLEGDQADYVGMAHLYKKKLEDAKSLPKKLENTSTLAIDFVLEDIEKGFFGNNKVEITSLDYVKKAIDKLAKKGIDDVHVSLMGWQNGGLHGSDKSKLYNNANFGSFSKLDDIKSTLKNGEISLYIDYLRAREPQLKDSKDAAISLSQLPVETHRQDKNAYLGMTYFLKFPDSVKLLYEQAAVFNEHNIGNPVVDGGNLLYGEYITDAFVSRSGVKNYTKKLFSKIAKNGKLSIFAPNDYLFAYTKEYRNASMNSSQHIFEEDTVPFLQIVLSGKIAMFAPYANDSFYSKSSVLKCIEYNCYPSFLMTEKDNYDIKDTALVDYSSTKFDDWNDTISEIYNEINGVLSNVKGQNIVNHSVVAEGVAVVTYESGSIIVNYNFNNYVWQGVEIPALSAVYKAN